MDRQPAGVALGLLLGLGNALVIAIGLSAIEPHDRAQMAMVVFMIGAVPALIVGVLLGWLAQATAHHRVWFRRLVLVVPAVLVVFTLGAMFSLQSAVLVSCIPTTAAAFWLERATRARVVPPVPVVAVHR